jgi:hypothetical protein
MQNPINPLNWLKATQNWFTRTERSSGFRPYLIFLILVLVFCLISFLSFQQSEKIIDFVLFILRLSIIGFIVLFSIKCFQDPSFCRSEKHVETVKRIELEQMGTEKKQVDAEIVDGELLKSQPKEITDNTKK